MFKDKTVNWKIAAKTEMKFTLINDFKVGKSSIYITFMKYLITSKYIIIIMIMNVCLYVCLMNKYLLNSSTFVCNVY